MGGSRGDDGSAQRRGDDQNGQDTAQQAVDGLSEAVAVLSADRKVEMANRIITTLTLITTAKKETIAANTNRPVMGRAERADVVMSEFLVQGVTK